MEHPKGASGQETDAQGIPWVEQHDTKELRRLRFIQWLQPTRIEPTTPQSPNPFPPEAKVTTVDTASPTSLGEFFDRRRRKTKPPGNPGI